MPIHARHCFSVLKTKKGSKHNKQKSLPPCRSLHSRKETCIIKKSETEICKMSDMCYGKNIAGKRATGVVSTILNTVIKVGLL